MLREISRERAKRIYDGEFGPASQLEYQMADTILMLHERIDELEKVLVQVRIQVRVKDS